MTLTKAKIVEAIHNELGFPKSRSAELIEILLELIKSSLVRGEDVLISGFGKFCVNEKRGRRGRNPATGEDMMLPPRRVVTFKCSGSLKAKISNKSVETEFEESGLKITARENYILVEPSKGVDFLEILSGISKLLSMPEFQDRNNVWVFRKDKMNIAYNDLYKIKKYVEINFPKCLQENKSAIVVETGMQKSLAEMYAMIEEEIPPEIKVFSDFKSAEEWITE